LLLNMAFCTWEKEEIYADHFETGIYVCAECSHPLFSSRSKYHHETPWPAFTKPIQEDSLKKVAEEGREEALKLTCGKCGAGLGHEFLKDGPDQVGSRF